MSLFPTTQSQQHPHAQRCARYIGLRCLQLAFICSMSFALASTSYANDRGPQLFRQGTQALQKGQYYKATQLLKGALRTLSHWGLVHLAMARAMQFNGDPTSAVERHLRLALQKLPRNPRAQLFAGLFYEAQGRSVKALPHYLHAIKLQHFAPTACLRAAALLIATKRGAKATPCLTALQKRRPTPPNTHLLLAKAHQQAQQWEAAAQQWEKALAQRPTSLTLLRKVFTFYQQHTDKQTPAVKRRWRQAKYRLQRQMRKLLPKKIYRRLRPLLPSKR